MQFLLGHDGNVLKPSLHCSDDCTTLQIYEKFLNYDYKIKIGTFIICKLYQIKPTKRHRMIL
jgi:hypothetical protein